VRWTVLYALVLSCSGAAASAEFDSSWLTDPSSGCGIFVGTNLPTWSVVWTGACKDGHANGSGHLEYRDRVQADKLVLSYDGALRAGVMEGHGTIKYFSYDASKDGGVYSGDFHLNAINGYGKFTNRLGTTYTGEWRDNQRSGFGVETSAAFFHPSDPAKEPALADVLKTTGGQYLGGHRYQGMWRDDTMNGQGTMIWSGGSRYDGHWRDGKPDGSGTIATADHHTYSGTWTQGCLHSDKGYIAVMSSFASCGFPTQ
jgi:hypothetical protein